MWTIDASVWTNADSPTESGSELSRVFLSHIASTRSLVVVPTLLRVEVAGAISRIRQDPALGLAYADRLGRLPFIQWIALDASLSERAAYLAAERGLRGADAVYAAVAVAHGCQLVSMDRNHLNRPPKSFECALLSIRHWK